MEVKHTPGPWAYRPSNSGHFIAGAGANSGYLAEVRHCRTNQDVKADARLIAAAPELLEALTDAVIDFDNWAAHEDNYPHEHLVVWAEKARAAIAKAKGE